MQMMDAVNPKKSLGQHWLSDADSLQAMCDAASVGDTDVVLEIGPGLGTLTEVLAPKVRHLVAVEYDPELAAGLKKRVPASNLTVANEDILRFDLTRLEPGYKVVANIPYYLTSNLLRVLSESANPPTTAVLLVQKEVAERVAAQPGSMSLLSVTAQIYWEVRLERVVKAALFTPPPRVDSQILVLSRRQQPLFPDADYRVLFRIVKAGFSQRRKTLLNALSGGLQLPKADVAVLLQNAGIPANMRAQNLSLEQWYTLYTFVA